MTSRSSLYPLVSIGKLEELLGRGRKDIHRIASSAGRSYRPFDMRVIGGTKWRHIDHPRGELRYYQDRIQHHILSTVTLPETILGGVTKRSIKDNLEFHRRPATLVRLDLRDCFPRISHRSVFDVFRTNFGCSPKTASILTKITTFQRRLPQGAPTSTTLANLTLLPMHNELQDLAARHGLHVTFWVDDIGISGESALDAIEPAICIIMKHGHAVRRQKIERMPRGVKQRITGGIVDKGISAGRKDWVQPLRDEIRCYDINSEVPETLIRSLWGKINYVNWLCPEQGQKLIKLARQHLPDSGTFSLAERSREVRPCKCPKRHSYYPRSRSG